MHADSTRECGPMNESDSTIDSLILVPADITEFWPMLTFGPSWILDRRKKLGRPHGLKVHTRTHHRRRINLGCWVDKDVALRTKGS